MKRVWGGVVVGCFLIVPLAGQSVVERILERYGGTSGLDGLGRVAVTGQIRHGEKTAGFVLKLWGTRSRFEMPESGVTRIRNGDMAQSIRDGRAQAGKGLSTVPKARRR